MFVHIVAVSRRVFFFSSRRRHTRLQGDWSSDVCSSDLPQVQAKLIQAQTQPRTALPAAQAAPSRASQATSSAIAQAISQAASLSADGAEIGRASCRERV